MIVTQLQNPKPQAVIPSAARNLLFSEAAKQMLRFVQHDGGQGKK
jgi:hypothetical protein